MLPIHYQINMLRRRTINYYLKIAQDAKLPNNCQVAKKLPNNFQRVAKLLGKCQVAKYVNNLLVPMYKNFFRLPNCQEIAKLPNIDCQIAFQLPNCHMIGLPNLPNKLSNYLVVLGGSAIFCQIARKTEPQNSRTSIGPW